MSASMLGCTNKMESTMNPEQNRTKKNPGNRMLDPTKTHNSMIYLFMGILKCMSAFVHFVKLWRKIKTFAWQMRAPLIVRVPFALFNIPLLQWSLSFTCETMAKTIENSDVLILIDDFNDAPEQHCYCYYVTSSQSFIFFCFLFSVSLRCFK